MAQHPGRRNGEATGTVGPDPTVRTTELIDRAIDAERDRVGGELQVLRERLSGIDEATKLRLSGIEGIPAQIEKEVGHLKEVVIEKIDAIEEALRVAETLRVEQKQDSKTSLDAALSAQKEAASEQNASNTLAISKSEQATAETIKTNQVANKATTDALIKSLDEVKLSVSRIESQKAGVTEQRVEQRAGNTALYGLIGAVGLLIFVVLALYAASKSGAGVS